MRNEKMKEQDAAGGCDELRVAMLGRRRDRDRPSGFCRWTDGLIYEPHQQETTATTMAEQEIDITVKYSENSAHNIYGLYQNHDCKIPNITRKDASYIKTGPRVSH
jgi:hypothetical protein